jgi:hypothetical protein
VLKLIQKTYSNRVMELIEKPEMIEASEGIETFPEKNPYF